ncbi:MAG TPA: class II glutamine amidotransferase [Steroidobacteraceae bacterium]|nr:class II glutamine amidotransferase [Steroidobacteraceae bacterium]
MCGIVGLLVKNEALRPRLGELMVPMLIGMTERGPDSSGMAVFTSPVADGQRKISLYAQARDFDWKRLGATLAQKFAAVTFEVRVNHAVMTTTSPPSEVRAFLSATHSSVHVLSVGRSIDLYKDVGLPADVAQRYDFARAAGTHLVGHTRMATESAVTPENAHPYTAGEDWCLVHNGSLANPGMLRRKLEKLGSHFESDCDTESACRYLHWRLELGESLETALHHAFEDFDGFFTFLMGTGDKLALVRDPFACKPAVVAETDEYVAIASEFRSLAHLPGVRNANVFEPKPEEVYSWSV